MAKHSFNKGKVNNKRNLKKHEKYKYYFNLTVLFIVIFILISCISYLFTWNIDQNIIVNRSIDYVKNICGFLGASVSYYLMYKWIGISIFILLIPILLFCLKQFSSKSIFNFNIAKLWSIIINLILLVNITLGYIYIYYPSLHDNIKFLTVIGSLAIYLGDLFNKTIGVGTVFLIIIDILFITYAFFSFRFSIDPLIKFINRFHKNKPIDKDKHSNKNIIISKIDLSDKVNENINKNNEKAINKNIHENNEKAINENIHENNEEVINEDIHENNEEVIDEDINEDNEEVIKDINADINENNEKVINEDINENNEEDINEDINENNEEVIDEDINENNEENTIDLVHQFIHKYDDYILPTIDLLDYDDNNFYSISDEELEDNKRKIENILQQFKFPITSISATIGPTVTLYEVVPQIGVKISRIRNLENDIALTLSALGVRIIAPIPGKGTIGIEVPNKNRKIIKFGNLIQSDEFINSEFELPIILGQSISNKITIVDLAKCPHLLIAGATGQGKSIGLNVILGSLLYKKYPYQLKFVLIDPKKVELSLYESLNQYFLTGLQCNSNQIITETENVIETLNSLCIEMDQRYDLLKKAGIKNIKDYNNEFLAGHLSMRDGHKYLPYIVLIIDEFADLIITAGKDIELPITRLTQLARAIGIHIILATQRPSVNVITGIIKANFPVRISFRVTSKIDSRTILDFNGAEQLIGQGDMLVSVNSSVIRLQCPYLDTQSIKNICAFISSQIIDEQMYYLPVLKKNIHDEEITDFDPYLRVAANLLVETQQGSTSLLQRRLKLGYNRAGRIIDQLEYIGVVSSADGNKPRVVLIHNVIELHMLLEKYKIN